MFFFVSIRLAAAADAVGHPTSDGSSPNFATALPDNGNAGD